MITVSFPGKLYIMGEYSILNPGHHAIVASVNRYLTVRIVEYPYLLIESEHGCIEKKFNHKLKHVEMAINVINEYLEYKGIAYSSNYHIVIESELDDGQHRKYGFGSSGVVIVAVIDAISKYHGLKLKDIELYKLAVYAQVKLGELSSGGELAATVTQGLILYRRPLKIPESIEDIDKSWEGLLIEKLNTDLNVEVGYTGQGFKSKSFLEKVEKKKSQQPNVYKALINEAETIVLSFVDDLDNLNKIREYREWMLKFSQWANIDIEIPILTKLIESANEVGYHAKISGAGGGDCGIALNVEDNSDKLKKIWKENGIEYLERAII